MVSLDVKNISLKYALMPLEDILILYSRGARQPSSNVVGWLLSIYFLVSCIRYDMISQSHFSLLLPPSHPFRYMDIPVISRLYFTGAFLTTAGCALDIISPFSLYFNFDLIFHQGQLWRLITTYLFFGMFSIDFLFHMYFLVSILFLLGLPMFSLEHLM